MGDTRTTHAIVEPSKYGVRRLTPVECERLQAFPDGWTEPAGSDSARYKALGNAVTVNTVRWVLGRMLEQS
jgi:DNA (cytosine-5)-methyltransferase 1